MKKTYIVLVILLILFGIGLGIYFYNTRNKQTADNSKNSGYDSARISANSNETPDNSGSNEEDNTNSTTVENKETENENNAESEEAKETENNTEPEPERTEETEPEHAPPVETQISDFTTKIYTKDKERQNNISITCSTLNDTIVDNGNTFSFCGTIGKSTTSKGYQKADVYKDGEVIEALGGGNCQVSSTLYNAVLKVEGLNVTERHSHSNSVPYVSKGKDAAVAYGSYDFKFVNNTGSQIKISASCDNSYVYIKIFKIS